jgi:hypothetical protein
MKTKLILLQILITVVIIFLPSLVHADPGGGGGDVQDNAPIDGGLSLLVAAGIGYGAKKIREKRKNRMLNSKSE